MPLINSGTDGVTFPSWTTASRPSAPTVGQMGYNTTTGLFDQYVNGAWVSGLTNASQSIPFNALPVGSILQVVNNISNPGTISASQNLITVSITPKYSSSKILLFAGVTAERNGGSVGSYVWTSLQRGGGAVNVASQFGNALGYQVNQNSRQSFSVSVLDTPATTSAITYAIYADYTSASAVPYVWYMCYITALEIAQ